MQTIKKQCTYCGKIFEHTFKYPSRSKRQFCSRSCIAKYSITFADKHTWSEEEQQLLADLVDTLPRRALAKKYNRLAIKYGFSKRTMVAIYQKAKSLRVSATERQTYGGIYDGWSLREICRLLKISMIVIQKSWKNKGLEIKRDGRTWIITKTALKRFARANPECFTLIHPYHLKAVLEDDSLVRKITSLGKPTKGRKHRVICQETGEIFDSMTAAATSKFVDVKTIYNSVFKDRACIAGTFKLLSVDSPNYAEYS